MNRTLKQIGAVALALGVVSVAAPRADAAFVNLNADDYTVNDALGVDSYSKLGWGEIRSGNRASNGDWEAGVGNSGSPFAPVDQGNFDWADGQNVWDKIYFDLSYDHSTDTLSLNYGADEGLGTLLEVEDLVLDDAESILLRTAARKDGSSIEGEVNGNSFGVTEGVNYWQIAIDGTNSWAFDGYATFTFGSAFSGSDPAMQFKITDVPPVPLPAAAWFMLTALGGLVGSRWLKGRTADQAA